MTTSAPETLTESLAQVTAKVSGMDSALSAGIVESALHELPGVEKVSVSLPDEQALVEYDPVRGTRSSCWGRCAISGSRSEALPRRTHTRGWTKTRPRSSAKVAACWS